MNKSKPTNGIMNVDTPQVKQMRAQVVEQELSARSWKAYYEKMYFSMEAEKLEPEYAKYKTRMEERLKKEKEEYEKFMKNLQESMKDINKENPLGELSISEPSTEAPVIKMK